MHWLEIIGSTISFLGFIPYIFSIIRGETKPHLFTWFIWTVIGTILCFSYYASGAPPMALLLPIAYAIGPCITFCFALYYGEKSYDTFDILCLILAGLSLIVWYFTGEPVLTLVMNILIDFFGAVPTVRKVYHHPETENLNSWLIFSLGTTINLIGLPEWTPVVMSYPFYLWTITITIALIIVLTIRTTKSTN